MVEAGVHGAGQASLDLVLFSEHGFPADVARRGDERRAESGQQQVMERAVGQHHAYLAEARRDHRRQAVIVAFADEHDRACRAR